MTTPAQTFADALQTLESGGDVDAFVAAVFTDDAVLLRPETGQELQGTDGARKYWQQYLAQFAEVRSEFSRVRDADGMGVLEWTSRGSFPDGADLEYTGVSLLEFGEDDRVTRFATYFDTARFATRGIQAPATEA